MAPNSGAPSSTRLAMPRRASASAVVSPPSPPPTMRMGSDFAGNAFPAKNRRNDTSRRRSWKSARVTYGATRRCDFKLMQQSWKPKAIDGVPDGLVLFDGVCVLCSGWVQFLIERDRDQFFRFTPIQSPYGRALAQRLGIDAEAPQTNAVIIGGRAYFKVDSAIAGAHPCAALALGARASRSCRGRCATGSTTAWHATATSCSAGPRAAWCRRRSSCAASCSTRAARPRSARGNDRDMRSPFERLLGADLERLPAPVRRVHSLRTPLATAGRADITAASGLLAWLTCWFAGLPRPGRDIGVSVTSRPRRTAASTGTGNSPTGATPARWRSAPGAIRDS